MPDPLLQLTSAISGSEMLASERARTVQAREAEKSTQMLGQISDRLTSTNTELEDTRQRLCEMIQQQIEANRLQEQSNQLLREQVLHLKQQAEELKIENQRKEEELKKERAFAKISYWITTGIAILAVVISIVDLFLRIFE